jgi:hypothetical protein
MEYIAHDNLIPGAGVDRYGAIFVDHGDGGLGSAREALLLLRLGNGE